MAFWQFSFWVYEYSSKCLLMISHVFLNIIYWLWEVATMSHFLLKGKQAKEELLTWLRYQVSQYSLIMIPWLFPDSRVRVHSRVHTAERTELRFLFWRKQCMISSTGEFLTLFSNNLCIEATEYLLDWKESSEVKKNPPGLIGFCFFFSHFICSLPLQFPRYM